MKLYYKIWGKNKIALSLDGEDIFTEIAVDNAKNKTKEEIKERIILNNQMDINDELEEIQ